MDSLVAQFSAIDTVLSLHYASSITPPKVGDICAKATTMCGKAVATSTIGTILAYYPNAYKIMSYGPEGYDYCMTVPSDVSLPKFGTLLPSRKEYFRDLVYNSKETPIPIKLSTVALENVSKNTLRILLSSRNSPTKSLSSFRSNSSSPNTSPTKSRVSKTTILRNDLSKFLFKEKIAAVEMSKALGLSLLERIRLKEKMNRTKELPEVRYQINVKGKMPAVYDVLYELSQTLQPAAKFRSFELRKTVSIIRDSFDFEIPETEVVDVIRMLETTLNGKIQILKRGEIEAVKIHPLDRKADLELIKLI